MALSHKICTNNDLDVLIQISRETFIHAFEKHNDPKDFQDYIKEAFSRESIAGQLNNPDSLFYFAYLDDELIGYFKLNSKAAQTESMDGDSIELERIYILESYQNKGLGNQLLNEIIKIAKANNHEVLWLGVWEKNTAAIRFYERHGFQKIGSHPYFVGQDKQTDWLMKLDLL
ncbi:MAG: GNAT family N-acetyltransferase [Bacteroidia bacterium]|nr:GNAT family N-acetyltransferase [Bacteroidia bacterium]NND51533.1 GNAT family N-acetyltransferase [Flavobacteriaceae bacterium]